MRAVSFFVLGLVLAACADEAPSDAVAGPGDTVVVAYEGRLDDGTVFDQNDRATFNLRQVIPGFQYGISGMRVGETKTLELTPEQGYGASPPPGSGIPPNASLTFDVTLLDVEEPASAE